MRQKKELPFPMMIIAFVIGIALFKQIDFEKGELKSPLLAIVYFLTFVMALYFIFRKEKKKEEE